MKIFSICYVLFICATTSANACWFEKYPSQDNLAAQETPTSPTTEIRNMPPSYRGGIRSITSLALFNLQTTATPKTPPASPATTSKKPLQNLNS